VNDQLKRDGRCLVVVSEGFQVGTLGERRDNFGHVQFSASETTVAQVVINHLNRVGLAARGSARCNVPGTDQRHAMALASTVDLEEAYQVGRHAASLAADGESGKMATILRNSGAAYSVRYDAVPLKEVANSERQFPDAWIHASGMDVTDGFLRYCRPLVGSDMVTLPLVDGRQRLARLKPIFAEQKLPPYVPQAERDERKT